MGKSEVGWRDNNLNNFLLLLLLMIDGCSLFVGLLFDAKVVDLVGEII